MTGRRWAEGARIVTGASPRAVRQHNERLILTALRRDGAASAPELAEQAGLTPQAVSGILRALEEEGLVRRGEPERGRVGKPRVPVHLAPDGAFALGLKIGRRGADLCLVDFTGAVRAETYTTYRWPEPGPVLTFLRESHAELVGRLTPAERDRIVGVGICKPYEIWNWHETIGAPPDRLAPWRDIDLAAEVEAFAGVPGYIENDSTAACRAELVYGRGREFRDFASIFVGSFVGGGVVLRGAVFDGVYGNAGAYGSLPVRQADGREAQLIDAASIYLLEEEILRLGLDASGLWTVPMDWTPFAAALDPWLARAGDELARAAIAICAVIDFEAVLIDGAFPADVRARLVEETRAALDRHDRRGLAPIRIEEGLVGGNARALGAASIPLAERFFLNPHAVGGAGPSRTSADWPDRSAG